MTALPAIITVAGERLRVVSEKLVRVTPKEGEPYSYVVVGTVRADK